MNIRALDRFGKELSSLNVNPLLIRPGIEIEKGKSDFVSTI
jgi:hypothetical protein